MSWRELFRSLKNEWREDKASEVAAALTFFGVLALFPFIIFMVALASLLIEPAEAESLIRQLEQVAPAQVTAIVADRIRELGAKENTGILTFGILGSLWAASGGMNALIRALNTAYDVDDDRPFWKVRGLSIAMTIVASTLATVGAAVVVAIPPIADAVGGVAGTTIRLLRLPVGGALIMLVWALLYWKLPAVKQRFKFITPGSIIGVVVWLLASWAFSVYVRNFGNYDATYGALGGVVVLLFWMWISAQVLVLGAEVNSIIEHASPEGKDPGQRDKTESRPRPVRRRQPDRPRPRA
jgi:membrane protein